MTSNRTVTTPSNGTIADYRQALTEAIREKDIASEMLKENEKDIKELEAEIEDIKEQINETMAQAINDG